MAVYRSTYEAAKKTDRIEQLFKYAAMDAGQLRVEGWLREAGLTGKAQIGVIAMWEDGDTSKLLAHAKVITSNGSFEHSEIYIGFPSDAFKAKVLLVTGGA